MINMDINNRDRIRLNLRDGNKIKFIKNRVKILIKISTHNIIKIPIKIQIGRKIKFNQNQIVYSK
jgi:hypothetical protein